MKTVSRGKAFVRLTVTIVVLLGTACNHKQDRSMASADQDQACSAVLGFELFNGQIVTMDELETIASSITIDNDQIVAL